jgi:hypothetical protein
LLSLPGKTDFQFWRRLDFYLGAVVKALQWALSIAPTCSIFFACWREN